MLDLDPKQNTHHLYYGFCNFLDYLALFVVYHLLGLGREHCLLGSYSILGLPWVRILRTDVYT